MIMYKRGDIVSVIFPFTDVSATKRRPALVISNSKVNKTGDYLLIQITSKIKKDDFSIILNKTDYSTTPLLLNSYVRIHKIFLLNESLILKKVSSVKSSFLKRITDKINGIIQ